MADAAIHGHDHDQRGFFTRWFMSTKPQGHRDPLPVHRGSSVGLISVAMTVYMRMELMYPRTCSTMCQEGMRLFVDAVGSLYAQRAYVERPDHHGPRHPDDVLRGDTGAVRRFWQLFHAAADRRARYGVPADEQPVATGCSWQGRRWRWRRFSRRVRWRARARRRRGLGAVSAAVDHVRRRLLRWTLRFSRFTFRGLRRSWGRST